MCTYIMLYSLLEDYPVIALHNRYLGLDTREETPRALGEGAYAPIDVSSQGTWIGVNKDGLLLAITNQETHRVEKPGRSRGLLALDILRECNSAFEAKSHLTDVSIRHLYRPGNFVVADREYAWHILWDHETRVSEIKPGPYTMGVVTMYPGAQLDDQALKISDDSEKRRCRALELLADFQPSSIDDALSKMMQVSADHEYGKSTASICWHSDEYKQTSSTLIAVNSVPSNTRVLYCEGNSCTSKFKEYPVSFN